jgi:nucleoside phosphorylase
MTLSDRELFRRRIDSSMTADDAGPRRLGVQPVPRAALAVDWPAGLEPVPVPIDPEPDPTDPLPQADAVVFVWTAAEWRALADTLTPGVDGPRRWYRYTRDFERYLPSIRAGAPARNSRRLGAYHLTTIGSRRVLLVKSELHLNQDAVRTGDGTATLPVADFTRQVLAEVRPTIVLTTGTCGATIPTFDLGDVLVTRGAAFRLEQEFRNEPFASAVFTSRWKHRRTQLSPARKAMAEFAHELVEPDFGAPTPRYAWTGDLIPGPQNIPSMKLDGDDFPDGHPILTADWFLFGTTTNGVDADGCGVEMGDAVIAMVCEENSQPGPEWLVVRNLSNPVVDGRLSSDVQNMWSAFYYDTYGYWTSVNSSIACWAALAP